MQEEIAEKKIKIAKTKNKNPDLDSIQYGTPDKNNKKSLRNGIVEKSRFEFTGRGGGVNSIRSTS